MTTSPTVFLNPLFRNKARHLIYCAGCRQKQITKKKKTDEDEDNDDVQLFSTCPCTVFKYCSITCQESVLRHKNHQRDCQMLCRFKGKNMNVQFAGLAMKNEFTSKAFCQTSSNDNNNNEKRAHIYEQVLDEYLYRYEQIKAMGMSTDVGVAAHQDFILIKSRIPFLLAALGHDDLAVTELAMTMDFSGRSIRQPRTKYDDIIQHLFEERRLQYDAWPVCFLLPLLLVKLRLVLDWKTYTVFMSNSSSSLSPFFPEDVRMAIADFIIDTTTTTKQQLLQLYRDQKRQLRTIIDLLLQQEDDDFKLIDLFETSYYCDSSHHSDLISCKFILIFVLQL